MHVCVSYRKMSHHSGAAAGCIHLALVCVCVSEKDRKSGCEGQMLLCTIAYSFTFFFPFFFCCFHFSTSLPPFPSHISCLHFCLFSGGLWFHHGRLGLKSSHNDWRTVHLQPQGGGPHLPSLPR